MAHDFEWYPTPKAFTSFLVREMQRRGFPIGGWLLEPCVGDGAIVKAIQSQVPRAMWMTNDLDPKWKASFHFDATLRASWERMIMPDWVITNPPFSLVIPFLENALSRSRVGVIMHLRMSFNEPTIGRRDFLRRHPPSGLLFLPRFAYRRSPNGEQNWSTDNVGAVWAVWLHSEMHQFIGYADDQCCAEAVSEAPDYRRYMDAITGWVPPAKVLA